MKKIFLLITLLLFIQNVNAQELLDVTNDIEVKAKWYKEEIEELYYPKGKELQGYEEDSLKIKKGNIIEWKTNACDTNLQKRTIRRYKLFNYTQFIRITDLNSYKEINILYLNMPIDYEIIKNTPNEIIINLLSSYETHHLTIYIDSDDTYNIQLSFINFYDSSSISKFNTNEKLLYVNNKWTYTEDSMTTIITVDEELSSPHIALVDMYEECPIYEELTYRYKIKKTYYDDNYHNYIEGYTKDTNNLKYFYKGNEIIKTIEIPQNNIITKFKIIEKKPQIITEYIERECKEEKIENNCKCEEKTKEIKEKSKSKNNKVFYIVIISIIVTILIIKKMSSKLNS